MGKLLQKNVMSLRTEDAVQNSVTPSAQLVTVQNGGGVVPPLFINQLIKLNTTLNQVAAQRRLSKSQRLLSRSQRLLSKNQSLRSARRLLLNIRLVPLVEVDHHNTKLHATDQDTKKYQSSLLMLKRR